MISATVDAWAFVVVLRSATSWPAALRFSEALNVANRTVSPPRAWSAAGRAVHAGAAAATDAVVAAMRAERATRTIRRTGSPRAGAINDTPVDRDSSCRARGSPSTPNAQRPPTRHVSNTEPKPGGHPFHDPDRVLAAEAEPASGGHPVHDPDRVEATGGGRRRRTESCPAAKFSRPEGLSTRRSSDIHSSTAQTAAKRRLRRHLQRRIRRGVAAVGRIDGTPPGRPARRRGA